MVSKLIAVLLSLVKGYSKIITVSISATVTYIVKFNKYKTHYLYMNSVTIINSLHYISYYGCLQLGAKLTSVRNVNKKVLHNS